MSVLSQFRARAATLPKGLRLAFCPNGPGGGVTNDCSSSSSGGTNVAIPRNLGQIFRTLAREGGFTYNPTKGTQPTKGWAVSVEKQKEKRFEGAKKVTVDDMLGYWKANREFLSQPDNHFGGWVTDDGTICLDVSKVVNDRATAERLGREADQDAIFDLETKTVVNLR